MNFYRNKQEYILVELTRFFLFIMPNIFIKIIIEKAGALLHLDQSTNLEPLVATVLDCVAHICNHDYCNSFDTSLPSTHVVHPQYIKRARNTNQRNTG